MAKFKQILFKAWLVAVVINIALAGYRHDWDLMAAWVIAAVSLSGWILEEKRNWD